ncbi:DHA2 family efflux MFS transporter permease subunit [Telmatospirillum sp.]|uniref:DHA2 family efflux MFS transporter permease subunit n=1 Tax=Telmatospirillum sp. TaxID=2079197 RepID=UPI0028466459|nr:DHA2 family efflux MFS transporter permease subunit [Telmatospirillum sp.]MDR3438803.1 DHA2 family efflux MFS transporter permease subunit [Telmatospirillum sp.]
MSPIEAYTVRFGAWYKWFATVTVMTGTIVTTAASTMVNVALPDIMGAFGLGQDQAQWLSTGFLAAMTATMLLTAWALGRFGYRLSFLGALALFIVGSVAGAASSSGTEVILARVLQGMASGLIQPVAMVVLSQVFPREQRGRAMGIYLIGVVLAPALGPTLGGYLVDEYNWRDVFLALIPVCLVPMAAAAAFLPGRDTRQESAALRFDGFGFLFLAIFLVCLLSALSNGQREGWNSDLILSLFALTLAFGVSFVAWELTYRIPLLNLRVFANVRFTASCLVAFVLGAGIYGSTYIVPLFVQLVQGYTPTRSGLLLMPAGFALALVSPLAGHLGDRLPPWLPVMFGLMLFGLSNGLCSGADVDTPFWSLAGWIVLGRIGLGLITPSLNAGALRALPSELLAQGSGTINFVRQLGGAMGVNLLSVLIDRRTIFHGDALALAMTPATSAASATVQQLSRLLEHWGNPFGTRLPSGAPPAAMAYLETVLAAKAQLFAYQDGFLIVAVMFFIALLPAMLMRRGRPV